MDTPYDQESDPPSPRRRALRGTVQALVGMAVALLAVAGFEVPAEEVVPITGGLVILAGWVQNAHDAGTFRRLYRALRR